jgi:hypothetical protein
MTQTQQGSGSAGRWGPLFGAHARDWAETWEGPGGWGSPVYQYVLDRAKIGFGDQGAGLRLRRRALRADGGRSRRDGRRH